MFNNNNKEKEQISDQQFLKFVNFITESLSNNYTNNSVNKIKLRKPETSYKYGIFFGIETEKIKIRKEKLKKMHEKRIKNES